MKKEKCFTVLVTIGIVASYKLSFSKHPTTEEIKEALDDKLKFWNIENGDNLTLTSRIEGTNIFVNNIMTESLISEDIFYNNGSVWTPVKEGLPNDNDCVLVTYTDSDGIAHVAQSVYTDGGFYFDIDTEDGCICIPIRDVSAWMLQPAPYKA